MPCESIKDKNKTMQFYYAKDYMCEQMQNELKWRINRMKELSK